MSSLYCNLITQYFFQNTGSLAWNFYYLTIFPSLIILFFIPHRKILVADPLVGIAFYLIKQFFNQLIYLYEDDHILAIKVISSGVALILVGVYLTACRNTVESSNNYSCQLTILSGLLEQYSDEAEIIFCGDFQAFPTLIYDTEARNHPTRNCFSPYLASFLSTNELELIDVVSGAGPNFTYHHVSLNHKSYIDHVAVLKNSTLDIISCGTLESHALNTSDHFPVFLSLTLNPDETPKLHPESNVPETSLTLPSYIWKNSQFLKLYQDNIQGCFNNKQFDCTNIDEEIEWLYNSLKSCALRAYHCVKTVHNHNIRTKPWWTNELSKLKKDLSYFLQPMERR